MIMYHIEFFTTTVFNYSAAKRHLMLHRHRSFYDGLSHFFGALPYKAMPKKKHCKQNPSTARCSCSALTQSLPCIHMLLMWKTSEQEGAAALSVVLCIMMEKIILQCITLPWCLYCVFHTCWAGCCAFEWKLHHSCMRETLHKSLQWTNLFSVNYQFVFMWSLSNQQWSPSRPKDRRRVNPH